MPVPFYLDEKDGEGRPIIRIIPANTQGMDDDAQMSLMEGVLNKAIEEMDGDVDQWVIKVDFTKGGSLSSWALTMRMVELFKNKHADRMYSVCIINMGYICKAMFDMAAMLFPAEMQKRLTMVQK
jgi:hypothetical protein